MGRAFSFLLLLIVCQAHCTDWRSQGAHGPQQLARVRPPCDNLPGRAELARPRLTRTCRRLRAVQPGLLQSQPLLGSWSGRGWAHLATAAVRPATPLLLCSVQNAPQARPSQGPPETGPSQSGSPEKPRPQDWSGGERSAGHWPGGGGGWEVPGPAVRPQAETSDSGVGPQRAPRPAEQGELR